MEQAVNLDFFIRLIRKYWKAIIGFTVMGLVIAAGVTFFIMTPMYQSSIQILVNRNSKNAATEYAGQQADVQMITTYKELITNQVILAPAKRELNQKYGIKRSINDLKDEVSVTSTTNSQVFSIEVKDSNPRVSAQIANQVARSFKNQIKKIIKVNNVTIVAPAVKPRNPVSPRKAINLLAGLLIGLLIGFIYASVRVLTDRRVKDVAFITGELGLTSLGIVNHQHRQPIRSQIEKLHQREGAEAAQKRTTRRV